MRQDFMFSYPCFTHAPEDVARDFINCHLSAVHYLFRMHLNTRRDVCSRYKNSCGNRNAYGDGDPVTYFTDKV